jgi:hypothetical protein
MNLSRRFASVLLSAALVSIGMPAFGADAVVGNVKVVKGDAYIVNKGQQVKATVGAPLASGDTLKTSAGASLGITFKDNTVMSFGPAPSQGKLKLGATIGKGTLAYLSGAIAKLKPEAVSLKTPTGTIGVRGTHFVIKVEAE